MSAVKPVMPALGVVLAGGASRRMGAPKAGLPVGGGTLIERPIATLEAAGLEVVVVAKPDSVLPALAVERWSEPATPRHPLCGIVAALERAGRPIVVIACDMPFVPATLVTQLAASSAAALVPSLGGSLEPLVARYDPAVLHALRAALERQAPLRRAVADLEPETIDDAELARHGDPRRIFANVNSPGDLARLLDC